MRVDLEEYRKLEVDYGAAVHRAQIAEAKLADALAAAEGKPSEPVAWLDDGSTRAGSDSTSFRVVTAATKATMPNASAVNFNTPLYTRPALSTEGE